MNLLLSSSKSSSKSNGINSYATFIIFVFLFLQTVCVLSQKSSTLFRVSELRVQGRKGGSVINSLEPKFSWKISHVDDGESQFVRNSTQLSFSLRLFLQKRSSNQLTTSETVWTSGELLQTESIYMYKGPPLMPLNNYSWQVKATVKYTLMKGLRSVAKTEETDWSALSSFIVSDGGSRNSPFQKAVWVSESDQAKGVQADYLRREFTLPTVASLTSATVTICGLGHFKLYLNGDELFEQELAPSWTHYNKTCAYLTTNVPVKLFQSGSNAIGVILGNGMYNVNPGNRYAKFVATFGNRKLIFELHLSFSNGADVFISSDLQWKGTSKGPIVFNSIYGGEDYDARNEFPLWNLPGFNDDQWGYVVPASAPGCSLILDEAPPIKVQEIISPIKVSNLSGVFIYDFGKNFAGRPFITIRSSAENFDGSFIQMIPGELLDRSGHVSQSSSGGPSYWTYVAGKNTPSSWRPLFSYYGFRYLQVQYSDISKISIESVSGEFMHSDLEVVGNFNSSNQLYNQIHSITLQSIKCNMMSLFTDCPHRERLGWLEETHLMAEAISSNLDVSQLFTKILRDMKDSQLANGLIPDIAPEYVVFQDGFRDSPEWGSAGILVPYFLIKKYNQIQPSKDFFPMMVNYEKYLNSVLSKSGLLEYGLGDWMDWGQTINKPQLTSGGFTASATYYQDLLSLTEISKYLGMKNETMTYWKKSQVLQDAFNDAFYDPFTPTYDTGSDTALGMPLALGLVEIFAAEEILENLVSKINAESAHISAGEIGNKYVLNALMSYGRADVIEQVLRQGNTYGYPFLVDIGATSLPESWNGDQGMSQIHAMFGHIENYFYSAVGGFYFSHFPSMAHQAAFRGHQSSQSLFSNIKLIVKPEFGLKSVDSANVSHDFGWGSVVCYWHKAYKSGPVQDTSSKKQVEQKKEQNSTPVGDEKKSIKGSRRDMSLPELPKRKSMSEVLVHNDEGKRRKAKLMEKERQETAEKGNYTIHFQLSIPPNHPTVAVCLPFKKLSLPDSFDIYEGNIKISGSGLHQFGDVPGYPSSFLTNQGVHACWKVSSGRYNR